MTKLELPNELKNTKWQNVDNSKEIKDYLKLFNIKINKYKLNYNLILYLILIIYLSRYIR